MRLPSDLAPRLSRLNSLGVICDPAGVVSHGFDWGWGDTAYPPPGYLPWRAMEVGNGDTYGFYWPIGREQLPPVICTLMHDEWTVLPICSNMNSFLRLHFLLNSMTDEETPLLEEISLLVEEHSVELLGLSDVVERGLIDQAEEDGLPYWGTFRVDPLLEIDAQSPHLNMLAGKQAIADRRLELAEKHLLAAVDLLPEYSEAWGLLALVYRQLSRHSESAAAAMQGLTSPQCFGVADRKRLGAWLKQMKDATYTGNDPLWPLRASMDFSGDGENPTRYAELDSLIESYHSAGLGARAVRLRVLAGEMMSRETVSFQDRAGWSATVWRASLTEDLQRAGIQRALSTE